MAGKKKGKKKGRKSGRKGKKKGKKGPKSSKRSKAARKAARTRAANKAKRSAAAKKAARSRKRGKKGKKSKAREGKKKGKRGKGKRKGGKRKGGKRKGSKRKKSKGKRRKHASPKAIFRQALRSEHHHQRQMAAYKKKYEKAIARAEKATGHAKKRHADLAAKYERLHHQHRQMAAEARKGKHRRRGHGRKSRRRNPVSGMGEHIAMGAGVLFGALATVIPYRLIKSHKLLQGQGAPNVDAPAQGDVPNLLAASLPVWGGPMTRKLVAIGVYIAGDIALPFGLAYVLRKHHKTVTFLETWGWTAVGLGATKLTIDVAALATKSTALGLRLFPAENTARSVRAQSATAQLPPIPVASGQGLAGLIGYGRAATGAGCGGDCACAKCKGAAPQNPDLPGGGPGGGSKGFAPGGTPTPGSFVAPGGNPAAAPAVNPMTGAAAPPKQPEAPPSRDNVRHITAPGRFSSKRFSGGRFG